MKKKLTLALAVLIVTVVFVLRSCSSETIQPVFVNNELHFKIEYGSTNGLLGLVISDASTGKALWNVNLAYFHGKYLKYGEVPQKNNARQIFPTMGMPSGLIEGKIYRMYSDWQEDYFGCASFFL